MKNYTVNLIKKNALILKGTGDDSLWNTAEVLDDFISPWDNKAFDKTEFKALWDMENIFFCFTIYDNNIHIDNHDNSFVSIGNSDRVELFFRKNALLNPYYCLEIDPKKRVMDFIAYPDKKFDFEWNWPKNDIKIESHISNNKFTIEIAISIASLSSLDLIKDHKIEVGIFRAKYIEKENSVFEPIWISWVNPNTEQPNFHTPSSFGTLQLSII
jgi:hypothetical protein